MSKSSEEKIKESRILLQNPYAYLDSKGRYEAKQPASFREILLSRKTRQRNGHWSYHDIECVAKELQNKLWRDRSAIWPHKMISNPVDILDPFVALLYIGYGCELTDSLGRFSKCGELFEVAGTVDNASKRVRISKQFSNVIQNFTAAHELGHALLHETQGLHRDRPLDGTASDVARSPVEREADKFATYFLMPEKQIKTAFRRRFLSDCFHLNEATMFALSGNDAMDLEKYCRTPRDLSRVLAKAERYNGVYFFSLAGQFCVSYEAMAIRLEELGLLEL